MVSRRRWPRILTNLFLTKSTANPSRPWRRSPASACAYSMRGEFATASCRRREPLLTPKVPLRFQESDEAGGWPGIVIRLRPRQGASKGAYPDVVQGSDRSTSDLYPPGPDRPD